MISLRTAMSLLAAAALSFLLISGGLVWAGESTTNATPAVDEQVEDSTAKQTTEKRKQILEEATGAIRETVISVTNVPLATYPDAIRLSAGLIDEGEMDAAADVLQTALNTLVVTDTIESSQPDADG